MVASTEIFETLQIRIRPLRSDPRAYQVTLFQPGVPVVGGPTRPEELITLDRVQTIRAFYKNWVEMFIGWERSQHQQPSPPRDPLIEFGQEIAALLPLMARRSLVETIQRAQQQNTSVRVLFSVTPDARPLLVVPWELMVLPLTRGAQTDDGGAGFLLLNANISFVRQVQGVGRHVPPVVDSPLELLALAATPEAEDPIEVAPTREVLRTIIGSADWLARWYDGVDTLKALFERVYRVRPQVLHLLCHGEQKLMEGQIRSHLLFTHQDGLVQRVSAFDLTPVLTLVPNLQLVVLQACEGGSFPAPQANARAGQDEAERQAVESIALALVRQGVPAVVAMQGRVGQGTAAAFVEGFYMALADGESLDRAVALGRIAMHAAGSVVDWSLPVIYQGGGQIEPATWFTRLADRADAALSDQAIMRSLRGIWIAWALVLLVVGLVRWLIAPAVPFPDFPLLVPVLVVWGCVGMVGPLVVAVVQRVEYDLSELDPEKEVQVRQAARLGQWMGAYLGYMLGSTTGLLVLASLWMTNVLSLFPPMLTMLILSVVLLCALAWSYTISRSQRRSALAIAPLDATLFGWSTLLLIFVAMLIVLVGAPVILLVLPLSIFNMLTPEPGALALALVLLIIIISFHESR